MYNFCNISSSRFREILGDDLYNNHWNDYLSFISGSTIVLNDSQITDVEQHLIKLENSTSGSQWFNDLLSMNNGSFK